MMTETVYQRLATHLDNLPAGFPATESGVELRILKRFFTPEEAEFALHLTLIPEPPRVVARRVGIGADEAAVRLEAMAKKGLLFRVEETPGVPEYMAAQYVIGIWEFHVNDLDPDLIRDMDEYKPYLLDTAWKQPQLRTIPVGQSIDHELAVMTYERAEELIRGHDRFSVNPCICRREKTMIGEGCDRPEASCLSFGMAADYAVKNGYGRVASREEILDLLKKADEYALVLQPGYSKEVNFICCCCGCCCGVLQSIKALPRPVDHVASPFVARADAETCSGCGVCVDRCQMDALGLADGVVVLDDGRCIGCGLCVTTCPTGSLKLERKPESLQPQIPKDAVAAAIGHGRTRGKLGAGELVKLVVKSKMDRLLAPR
ncbi:MAG: 4Fe-4S binding protein [Desulfobacterales bacterium]|nr:4Fe-4S binding protein [Desulfobacterales bacterium]